MANGSLEDSKSTCVVQVLYYPPTPEPTVGSKRQASNAARELHHEESEYPKVNDDPVLNAAKVDGRLTMHFAGKAANVDANFLFDSGANDNFVSKSFAQMHGISIEPISSSVVLGNNQVAELVGLQAREFT
jgi:hypothetical protein